MGNLAALSGTSVVVHQFMAILRGCHAVTHPLGVRVETVMEERRFCPECLTVRRWDVAVGVPVSSDDQPSDGTQGVVKVAVGWCRVCGVEVWSNG